jgi:cytochrome c peroxidase
VAGAALMVCIAQADARDNDKTTGDRGRQSERSHDSKKETAARLDAQYETAVRTWDSFYDKWGRTEFDLSNEETYADHTNAIDTQNSYRDGVVSARQSGAVQTKGRNAYQEKEF